MLKLIDKVLIEFWQKSTDFMEKNYKIKHASILGLMTWIPSFLVATILSISIFSNHQGTAGWMIITAFIAWGSYREDEKGEYTKRTKFANEWSKKWFDALADFNRKRHPFGRILAMPILVLILLSNKEIDSIGILVIITVISFAVKNYTYCTKPFIPTVDQSNRQDEPLV